jgi:hypothetical protein
MFIGTFYAFVLALPILVASSILQGRQDTVCEFGSKLLCCVPHPNSELGPGKEGNTLPSQDDPQQQGD